MACDFLNVGLTTSCKENFSGVGSTIYAFTADDIKAVFDGTTSEKTFKMTYDATEGKARLATGVFAGVSFTPIKVKAKTGKVTATSTPDGGGFTNVYTGRIANDMDTMAYVARVMNNRNDWGLLVPTGKPNEYYVLYDPNFDIQFSMESDTGDATDSDHGHTITVTQGPMKYAMLRWTAAGALTENSASTITFA